MFPTKNQGLGALQGFVGFKGSRDSRVFFGFNGFRVPRVWGFRGFFLVVQGGLWFKGFGAWRAFGGSKRCRVARGRGRGGGGGG